MPDCPRIEKCPFFNGIMQGMPATSELFKLHYCRRHSAECARFRVAVKLGPEKVPADLFPNQMDRAMMLMQQA